MNPMTFNVPDGQDVDTCFHKIIVATKAVETGFIKQVESSHLDVKQQNVVPWTPPPDFE